MSGIITKGAKTIILLVLTSAIAAAIMSIMIFAQPQFLELIAQGNFWFLFSTFLTCWLLASIVAFLLLLCVTRRPQSLATTMAD